MDVQHHLRQESVARKRSVQQDTSASSSALSPLLASSSSSSSSTTLTQQPPPLRRSQSSKEARQVAKQRRTWIRNVTLLVVALIALRSLLKAYDSQRVDSAYKRRKHKLAGAGESHVLPKKYRDSPQRLPECKRVLLYTLQDSNGFASELNALLTAHVIATRTSRVLLVDDQDWNYGSLMNYFLPRKIHCRPPLDWHLQDKATPISKNRWSASDRVWMDKSMQDFADKWVVEEMLDSQSIKSLSIKPFETILPEGQTALPELLEIYNDYHAASKEIWRPNDDVAHMIRELRIDLGLGDVQAGVRYRKNSPTFGNVRRVRNPKAPADTKEVQGDDDDDDDDDDEDDSSHSSTPLIAERSDRGPVIGVHVRLGDKRTEYISDMRDLGIAHNSFGNVSTLVEGANDAVKRLSRSNVDVPGYSRNAARFKSFAGNDAEANDKRSTGRIGSRPTIVVMSAERDAVSRIADDPASAQFAILQTTGPAKASLLRWADVLKISNNNNNDTLLPSSPVAEELAEDDDLSTILMTFKQSKFNKLPKSLRVLMTRHFVRDLHVLSHFADAFVVTATSNVGRLACVLAGEEAVVGPRSLTGHYGGRIRSVDAPWHPTRRLSSLLAIPKVRA